MRTKLLERTKISFFKSCTKRYKITRQPQRPKRSSRRWEGDEKGSHYRDNQDRLHKCRMRQLIVSVLSTRPQTVEFYRRFPFLGGALKAGSFSPCKLQRLLVTSSAHSLVRLCCGESHSHRYALGKRPYRNIRFYFFNASETISTQKTLVRRDGWKLICSSLKSATLRRRSFSGSVH